MKRIVIPTDFSHNSWDAIFTVLKLYDEIPSHFYLLNVFTPKKENISGFKSSVRSGISLDGLKEKSEKGLSMVAEYIENNHLNKKHSFELVTKRGDVVEEIKKLAHEKDVDLIVMGTKGATGLKKVFMGSNTVKVIKGIRNCPILAVPEKYDFKLLKKVVFPTEYAHFFSVDSLSEFLELIKVWQSKILIFHVAQEFRLNEYQQMNKDILKTRFREAKYTFHEVGINTTVADAIADFAEERDADMIALVHYQHTFLEKLQQEPIVKKMGFNTKVPILVLPEQSD